MRALASNHVQSMDTSEAENDVPKEQHLAEVQAALEGGALDTTAIPEDEVRQDGDLPPSGCTGSQCVPFHCAWSE